MKICMPAVFDVRNPKSWSGTPLSLYSALSEFSDVELTTVDLSSMHNKTNETLSLLKHLDLKLSKNSGFLKSKLGPSAMNPLNSRLLNKYLSDKQFDVLIEFGGFIPDKKTPPYYVYADSSRDMEIDYYNKTGIKPYGSENYSDEEMLNSADYVKDIYMNAAGIFCMSNYLKESLVNTTGVPAEKVYVVYAGANWHGVSVPDVKIQKSITGKKVINLLLTGVTYYGKGMDIAIEAVKKLNKNSSVKYILHLCGVNDLESDDESVICHGYIDKQKLVEMLNLCDLFVLPTRYDCFGISFVEAMSFGLPCIGRSIMAMPEIIDEGKNGEMINSDNPDELASLIDKICSDDALYKKYSESALKKSQIFQWDNVAEKMMEVIRNNFN